MKSKHLAAVMALVLLLSLSLGACGDEPTPGTDPTSPTTTTSTTPSTNIPFWPILPTTEPTTAPTTEPPLTLDTIRTPEFSDLPIYNLYYDTACYMLYYELMEAQDGQFRPYEMVTQADGLDALYRLTGQEQDPADTPDAPLTRTQLAVLLHAAADTLGYSTKPINDTLPYPDANQADPTAMDALLWVFDNRLFDGFVGYQLLPNTAVSRLQLAQAMLALRAMDPEDKLAVEIWDEIPLRSTDSLARDNHDTIQEKVDAAAKKYGATSIQVAVIENGVVTDTYTYGWATKKTDKMTADHKIRVASISKVAVGLTAQLLREDGIVDLDTDISEYWGFTIKNPDYPNKPITLRHILTHTSSIVNSGSTKRDYDSVKSMLKGSGFSSAVPGDIGYWVYNNYAFGVLGMTLELAANRVTDDILSENLFIPMDIDAAFGSGDIKNTDLLTTLYYSDGEVSRSVSKSKGLHSPDTPGASGTYFAGGLTSSAYDLAKLMALMANDGIYEGVRLMDAESIELMETRIEKPVPGGSYQALPMRYWPELYGREGIYFHTGSAYGVFNAATYDPVSRDGVVVLTTGASGAKDDYGIYKVCAAIMEYIYDTVE